MLIDTHCHIHDPQYPLDVAEVIKRARESGVEKMICIGTSVADSIQAVEFANKFEGIFAAVGVHPHDAKDGCDGLDKISDSSFVAVGEIGLDYFHNLSPREEQIKAFESQIQFALDKNKPIVFHVREAYEDFWPILDNFGGIRGELHCFTDSSANLDEGLRRGLYIGINGFSTFVKDSGLKEMFNSIPIDKMLFETDAPYLTPVPFRGKINEPMYINDIAEFHAKARNLSLEEIALQTTKNAEMLFGI